MRITCKCGGKRYKSTGPDPECIYYKCNNCNMLFTQKLRKEAGANAPKRPVIEILSTLAGQLRELADNIDTALEVMQEETAYSPKLAPSKKETECSTHEQTERQ